MRPTFSDLGLGIPIHEGQDPSLLAYGRQLLDEGYATNAGELALVIWPRLYDLIADANHQGSLALLELPDVSKLVPRISSTGTPSDPNFRIRIDGWRLGAEDISPSTVDRTGGLLTSADGQHMMSPDAYSLLGEITELRLNGTHWTSDQRMRALGKVLAIGRKANAVLDTYLSRTVVVSPERIDLELKVGAAAGAEVIEVVPRPIGVPPEWLVQFDRYNASQARYDVLQADGVMAHVMLPDGASEILDPIKALPARRVASGDAEAFLHNPYAFFGDGAEKLLDGEAIERAKVQAGIVERELDISPAEAGWDVILLDTSGVSDDQFEALATVEDAKALLSAASLARNNSNPTFRWRSHRVSLAGQTLSSLANLQGWTVQSVVRNFALAFGEVFDLDAYSDRVVGFDGKPIRVPFIGKADAGKDWIPENIGITIGSFDPSTGEATATHLNPEQVGQLSENVLSAKKHGHPEVPLPGGRSSVPVSEAEAWLKGMKDVLAKGPKAPPLPKDPKDHRETPTLKILHNIENLDYGSAPSFTDLGEFSLVLPNALRPSVSLFPHQLEGLTWLQRRLNRRTEGITGILLADDMGLGKTLQCLALIASYRQQTARPRPCLVVAPVSLLENWKKEIEAFLDGTQGKTIALYGKELSYHRLATSEIDPELKQLGMKRFLRKGFSDDVAIVLTTYETLRDYEFSLGRESWGVLVCDEAQKIKTPAAFVTRAAKAMQAEFKIACTGTPVENSLADLWCLFDFFQPALLGSLSQFTKKFRRSIELRDVGHEPLVEALRAAIEPWVLRRMKIDVATLPEKIDERHPDADRQSMALPMSGLQRKLYATTIADFKEAVNAPAQDREPAAVLALLHRLRMICANPLSVSDAKAELLPISEHLRHSPKLSWLLSQLERIEARGEKAIVFTEYRELQRIIQRAVAGKFGTEVEIVNGDTSVDPERERSRQALIDQFQGKPGFGVIVLSTTAVGFGVNIQKANHVIHFTRSWNPAKEDQATDRAYRIGQEKPVWVYCPTVAGEGFESFEQRLAERLDRKRSLSQDMLAPEQGVRISDFESL